MQNSQLYRQGVVMPKTAVAEESLRRGDADVTTPVLHVSGPGDLFRAVWSTGVFERVNAIVGSIIDEHEEEWIDARGLVQLCRVVEEARAGLSEGRTREWLGRLLDLATSAVAEGRPLLFVF